MAPLSPVLNDLVVETSSMMMDCSNSDPPVGGSVDRAIPLVCKAVNSGISPSGVMQTTPPPSGVTHVSLMATTDIVERTLDEPMIATSGDDSAVSSSSGTTYRSEPDGMVDVAEDLRLPESCRSRECVDANRLGVVDNARRPRTVTSESPSSTFQDGGGCVTVDSSSGPVSGTECGAFENGEDTHSTVAPSSDEQDMAVDLSFGSCTVVKVDSVASPLPPLPLLPPPLPPSPPPPPPLSPTFAVTDSDLPPPSPHESKEENVMPDDRTSESPDSVEKPVSGTCSQSADSSVSVVPTEVPCSQDNQAPQLPPCPGSTQPLPPVSLHDKDSLVLYTSPPPPPPLPPVVTTPPSPGAASATTPVKKKVRNSALMCHLNWPASSIEFIGECLYCVGVTLGISKEETGGFLESPCSSNCHPEKSCSTVVT